MKQKRIFTLQDNSNWRVAEVIYISPSSLPPKLSCIGTAHKIDLHDGINNTLIKNQWYICNDAPRCVQPIWSFHKLLLNQKSTPFDVHIVGWRRRGRGCMGRRGPGAAKSPPSTPPIILEPRYLVSIWVMQRAGYMVVQWVSVWLAVHFFVAPEHWTIQFFCFHFCAGCRRWRGVGPSEVNANAKDVCGVEGQESAKRAQHPTPDNLKPLNYNANNNGNTLSDALSLAPSIYWMMWRG